MTTVYQPATQPLPRFFHRLRAIALALGESARPACWNSEFMNGTGLGFLKGLHPQTTFTRRSGSEGKSSKRFETVQAVAPPYMPPFLAAQVTVRRDQSDVDEL